MCPTPRERLTQALEELSKRRPLFHTEADFQFELAWTLRERGWSELRLERPVRDGRGDLIYLDITARDPTGRAWAVELKYFNRAHDHTAGDECFALKQTAPDHGRMRFVKDIQRVEEQVRLGGYDEGAAVLLTNYATVWSPPSHGRKAAFDDFRVHEGRRVLTGRLVWARRHAGAVKDETKRRYEARLDGKYPVHWEEYSAAERAGARFRFLLVTTSEGL